MVWRDLDFVCICDPAVDLARVTHHLQSLLGNERVEGLHFTNERGQFHPDPEDASERYYYVLRYCSKQEATWKVDLSFFFSEQMRSVLEHVDWLRRELTEETRLAILWIKDVWHHFPTYPYEVGGYEVYQAVLTAGVRTPDQFDAYLRQHGLPGRPATPDRG
jgi:hypothetical protein